MNKHLLQRIDTYVTELFREQVKPELVYHSLAHTQSVVKAAEHLASHYQLEETQYFTVLAAAWFHDTGYLLAAPAQHEEKGAELAAAFLTENGVSAAIITTVRACILATKLPQSPANLLEQIVCDSDLFHLGGDDFKERTKLLRKEMEQLTGQSISGGEWRLKNIKFLQSHQYFTDYARISQKKGKADNLRRLLEKQAEKEQETQQETPPDEESQPADPPIAFAPIANQPTADSLVNFTPIDSAPTFPLEPKKKKNKDDRPERGIETMFRTTSSNHLRLSEIADSKANIMISVNSIMVSVIVSVLAHRLEQFPYLIPPTALFLTTALLTIIFAILATRPNVTQGRFSKEDIQQKKANLLFFGNFYNMTLEEYESGIDAMMHDSDFLYGSMTRDIYYLGVVLGKKYKLLRLAYNIFMFGFIVSILAFLVVFLINEK